MKYMIFFFLFIAVISEGCTYDKPFLNSSVVCDTAIVTYSGTVNPLLTTYCTGCHSGGNTPQGIRIDSYSAVKVIVANGKLLGSITYSPGFSPMPKNGAKLSNCDIGKIRKWITAGAPNN
jgi:hypothetical protein